MTTPPPDMPPGDAAWVNDGMRVGATLDDAHLILVLGNDPRATALAALGIARAQATRRRVALGDLLGDAEPIQELLNVDDPHGLADSFLYGVSINKIAQAVPQYGDLYVLPSGSEVPGYDVIFTNARWRRLAAGFRETGSLLVVAAPARAEHVADVVGLTDGVVLVGDPEVAGMDDEKVIARVAPVAATAALPNAEAGAPEEGAVVIGEPGSERSRWLSPAALGGGALALVLVIMGIWFAARPLVRGHEPLWLSRERSASAAGAVPSTLDSMRPDSTAVPSAPALTPANSADSANAAAYAVVVARFNTRSGAQIWLQRNADSLPSATFAPFRVNGETWYRAVAGSFLTRAGADSLLQELSTKGVIRPDSDNVIRAPFAFLVDSVTAEAVPGMLSYLRRAGQPVYALRQADGSARLYTGAFESAAEAALDFDAIRSGGNIKPVLVYRIGRVF